MFLQERTSGHPTALGPAMMLLLKESGFHHESQSRSPAVPQGNFLHQECIKCGSTVVNYLQKLMKVRNTLHLHFSLKVGVDA